MPVHLPARIHDAFSWAAAALAAGLLACSPGEETRAPRSADAPPATDAVGIPVLERLGGHSHPITTSSSEAQRYFDQGLALTYAFNHEAAVQSFEEALRLDPGCAMCAWGVAYALGPNINAPMGPEAGRRAHAAAQQALDLLDDETDAERAYVEAVATRYAEDPTEDRSALDAAYADAMRQVYKRLPDDVDAAALLAEALMDLTPWDYWTEKAEPRPNTSEALALLESVLERAPNHLGANHYYIHVVEKHYPEKGVPAADRLGALGLEAGHLVHMPSHIYWRVGRYEDAAEINRRAIEADETFFGMCRAGVLYRALYYPHNIHFLWASATAEGQSELALFAARKLAAETRDGLDEFDFLEEFVSIPVLALARFGRWDAVLGEPQPPESYRYWTGLWRYARGLALVRFDRLDEAQAELKALRAIADEEAARTLMVAGGTAPAAELLTIAAAHLAGEAAAAQGDTEAAVAALERAVDLQDGLVYMEPPPFYFPVRQALGAVLLDAGRNAEAEAVYRTDLEQYPGQGWSLLGLAKSLRGQGRADEADDVARRFEEAWARADVELVASRF